MNNDIFFLVYNFAQSNDLLQKLAIFFAEPFGDVVLVLAATFLLFHHEVFSKKHPVLELKRKWAEIILVFFTAFFARGITEVLKYIVHAPRPFIKLQNVVPLISESAYSSFPSGHATFYMALGVAIYLTHKRAGVFFIFCALIIGLARIAVGVHFPIDILAGFALGIIVPVLVKYFYKKLN